MGALPLAVLTALLISDSVPTRPVVQSYYFQLQDQSQVWVDLSYQSSAGLGPLPLNVTVLFPGHRLAPQKRTVELRVYFGSADYSMLPRSFEIIIDGQVTDLLAQGRLSRFDVACVGIEDYCIGGNVGRSALVAVLSFEELEQMADASEVEVQAMGFNTKLTESDLAAIRHLAVKTRTPITVH